MSSTDSVEAIYSAVDVGVNELDHDAWRGANAISISRYWSGEPAPASRHAQAQVIWTDTALLARFTCVQREPLIVSASPQTAQKTIRLWDRDVCEVFLIPDVKRPDEYFEFEAAPTGEWLDIALKTTLDGRKPDWNYSSGFTTASRLSKENLITALRIPWAGRIAKPKTGDAWRVNLCRCIGAGADRGYLAWQPTFTEMPNFHVTKVFGRLIFR